MKLLRPIHAFANRWTLAGTAWLLLAPLAMAECLPAGQTLASMQALKKAAWEVASAPAREQLAIDLLACLGDADPFLRDEVAFDALQSWMRKGRLELATVQAIRTRLLADLAAPADGGGFRRPFSALVLAEVARVDRLKPFLAPAERDDFVQRASAYLSAVRDYRGFDEREGWRHGVAHGADLVLQLSLNPLLTRAQVDALLAAIASQVTPAGRHFYQYGEGERLMAPVFYLARTDRLTPNEWDAWLAALVARLPKAEPATQASLAARHNITAFLSALYVSVRESGDGKIEAALLPGLHNAIKAVN